MKNGSFFMNLVVFFLKNRIFFRNYRVFFMNFISFFRKNEVFFMNSVPFFMKNRVVFRNSRSFFMKNRVKIIFRDWFYVRKWGENNLYPTLPAETRSGSAGRAFQILPHPAFQRKSGTSEAHELQVAIFQITAFFISN